MLGKSKRARSARHLNNDYVWDSLSLLLSDRHEDSPTFNPTANTQTAVSTESSAEFPLLADHPRKQKLAQVEIHGRSVKVLPSVPLPLSATAASPPQSSHGEQLKLQLHMESQELEIKRLQLELQLAQLKLASNTVNTPKPDESMKSDDRSSEKSIGNQRSPQRIPNMQEWPHIFTPGESKLFNELSMAEFSAGYTVIIQRGTDVSC